MELIFQLVVFAALMLVGLLFGRMAEKRHFRELAEKEAALQDILVFAGKRLPEDVVVDRATLVCGSVVVAEDYFKRVAAMVKGLVGGRLTAYESLMDRGRREAIVRMKEEARKVGATMVFNVRFETASLAEDTARKQPMFSAEFLAYGTALVRR
ncbi:YbjQ family protein [Noviluteimonas gilva]|uniref:Heavy metal-binding domain-containing protein n=1 Tax=Noviluteimonas gilva TaxID=2682097 RepID=A0A7C9M5I2_9GAMM|nr:heavy metal-binding domain-containing protein [Lysobacter gilvus]MUV15462.1 heavy metal-binding domain-containing protein [Lysobacter gilvus]